MAKYKGKIGFIGQGWIGKNYADDFANRGFDIVRYALEEEYKNNGEKIKNCDIVFIAVPTPTTPEGFDDSILRQAVKSVGAGNVAIIKSTILPGTTESIQKENPDIFVMHSPEFLSEVSAAFDAANPNRNIVGIPFDDEEYVGKAKEVLSVLPDAPYENVCKAKEAEFIKYGGNNWFYFKVIFINMLYDLAKSHGCTWEAIRNGMAGDPRIGTSHMNPVHKSGESGGEAGRKLPFPELHLEPIHKTGRGAGGHCFIKDYEAFVRMYQEMVGDEAGVKALEGIRSKNISLLLESEKDLDLLFGVYGQDAKNL